MKTCAHCPKQSFGASQTFHKDCLVSRLPWTDTQLARWCQSTSRRWQPLCSSWSHGGLTSPFLHRWWNIADLMPLNLYLAVFTASWYYQITNDSLGLSVCRLSWTKKELIRWPLSLSSPHRLPCFSGSSGGLSCAPCTPAGANRTPTRVVAFGRWQDSDAIGLEHWYLFACCIVVLPHFILRCQTCDLQSLSHLYADVLEIYQVQWSFTRSETSHVNAFTFYNALSACRLKERFYRRFDCFRIAVTLGTLSTGRTIAMSSWEIRIRQSAHTKLRILTALYHINTFEDLCSLLIYLIYRFPKLIRDHTVWVLLPIHQIVSPDGTYGFSLIFYNLT